MLDRRRDLREECEEGGGADRDNGVDFENHRQRGQDQHAAPHSGEANAETNDQSEHEAEQNVDQAKVEELHFILPPRGG